MAGPLPAQGIGRDGGMAQGKGPKVFQAQYIVGAGCNPLGGPQGCVPGGGVAAALLQGRGQRLGIGGGIRRVQGLLERDYVPQLAAEAKGIHHLEAIQ